MLLELLGPLSNYVAATQDACFYGLVALCYALILEATGFFNFAVGGTVMLAGIMTAYTTFEWGFPLWVGVLCGIGVAVVASVLTDVLVIRPIDGRRGGGELAAVVAVTALLFGMGQLAGTLFGREPLFAAEWIVRFPLEFRATFISWHIILTVAITLTVFAIVSAWAKWTRQGRMLRAVGDNREAARLLGLPVSRVRLTAFVLAGVIGGLAGTLYVSKVGANFGSGFTYSLTGFLAFVIGGRGSMWAPLVGAFALAYVQVWATYHLGGGALEYSTLLLAIVFFAFRPTGIIARKVRA